MANQFYIYILYTKEYDKYYVGYSADPQRRLEELNTYTSKYRPWETKAVFACGEEEREAIRMERLIKKQKSRKLIEKLADPSFVPDKAFAQLVRVQFPGLPE